MLNCPNGPVGLRESYGFGRGILSQIAASLEELLEQLCESWKAIHGRFR
jgi:hypothetical protein